MIHQVKDTDLIILPEMWNTGFSMTPKSLATTMDGVVVQKMQFWAKEKSASVGGSVIIKENGKYYNRFIMVDNTGHITQYDKKHLFTLTGEHESYKSGSSQTTINLNGWKLRLNICYDLRFPVWSRNTNQYDALIYVANWPSPRHQAWRALLQARAIENQCYVVGSNRVGTDPNGHSYLGGSTIIDYQGNHIVEMDSTECIAMVDINKDPLAQFRSKLDFLSDQDNFILT